MALKIPIPFPITAPPILNPNPNPTHHRPPSELRFSRWNNANAEPFNERRRAQQEIEDDIRRERRFDSANRIARYYDSATPNKSSSAAAAESFKSAGTPSFPSKRSIPGRKSKYSKNPYPNPNPNSDADSRHPAFRQLPRTKVPVLVPDNPDPAPTDRGASVRLSDDGVSYVIDGAPFEFKYSYTETPKVKPLGLREAAFVPFGPGTMRRPWTGRAPLPPSKKKLPEFDSFRLPPPSRKGVKTVQAPGPYLPGSGPRYVRSREEILGDPLTKEEIRELIDGCKRTQRQLNIGRDGLTHNMLDNIHAHWKRRRACKIKCKGVCTVDMDNVLQQLEERTGGKIIFNKGGVIYLFRGRNYNYRTRPRYPLMLWRPITPVYPRLVRRIPEGTTLQEVTEMRKKGHQSIPICKLGKNGVYSNLVNHVREAFEECELARINCEGLNGSDYRKIGAKLRDLVPCVLLSFAYEHILMWRGRDWKSALPKVDAVNSGEAKESRVENGSVVDGMQKSEDSSEVSNLDIETRTTKDIQSSLEPPIGGDIAGIEVRLDDTGSVNELSTETSTENEDLESNVSQQLTSQAMQGDIDQPEPPNTVCTEVVRSLLQQALEIGSATILDDADLDADIIYQKMVEFSQSAPPGPVFRHRLRKVLVKAPDIQENNDDRDILDLEPHPIATLPTKAEGAKKGGPKQKPKPKTYKKSGFSQQLDIVVPQGSLRVDELAKLLA